MLPYKRKLLLLDESVYLFDAINHVQLPQVEHNTIKSLRRLDGLLTANFMFQPISMYFLSMVCENPYDISCSHNEISRFFSRLKYAISASGFDVRQFRYICVPCAPVFNVRNFYVITNFTQLPLNSSDAQMSTQDAHSVHYSKFGLCELWNDDSFCGATLDRTCSILPVPAPVPLLPSVLADDFLKVYSDPAFGYKKSFFTSRNLYRPEIFFDSVAEKHFQQISSRIELRQKNLFSGLYSEISVSTYTVV